MVIVLAVGALLLAACGGTPPTQAPAATQPPGQPAQPPAQPGQPPAKETVIIKETVVVPATAAPTATPAATPTAAPGRVVAPAPAGKPEFTIEFGPSAPRKGDNKIQLTVILHVKGGTKPFKVLEDNIAQKSTATGDGVQYVRDWHNCGPAEPHTVTVVSGDGQQASEKVMMPYNCP
jgi:glucose/arabinose dehydrogenase